MTKLALPLWKAFWLYSIPISLLYQVVWGQVFAYVTSGDWTMEGYWKLLISKHVSEVVLYSFIIYFLAKQTSSRSQLAVLASCTLFSVVLLITVRAVLMDMGILQ